MRYSLRRAMLLDSVDGYTRNPKVGGSNPPPATIIELSGIIPRLLSAALSFLLLIASTA
jgi:hypothetical protein